MLYIVFGVTTLICVLIFPIALASMMKKVKKEKSVVLECAVISVCGLSLYMWIWTVFSRI